jgi:hypothetical protein
MGFSAVMGRGPALGRWRQRSIIAKKQQHTRLHAAAHSSPCQQAAGQAAVRITLRVVCLGRQCKLHNTCVDACQGQTAAGTSSGSPRCRQASAQAAAQAQLSLQASNSAGRRAGRRAGGRACLAPGPCPQAHLGPQQDRPPQPQHLLHHTGGDSASDHTSGPPQPQHFLHLTATQPAARPVSPAPTSCPSRVARQARGRQPARAAQQPTARAAQQPRYQRCNVLACPQQLSSRPATPKQPSSPPSIPASRQPRYHPVAVSSA